MTFLFNSKGEHIANFVSGQLHAPHGQNIGHYRERENIFIDMQGRYLGEIVYQNRLLYNRSSPYRSVNFGNFGNYGNVGNYGNPGNYGSVAVSAGYEDVNADWQIRGPRLGTSPSTTFAPVSCGRIADVGGV